MAKNVCLETELISADGTFNFAGLQKFASSVNLNGEKVSIVAIMGPQSSGKSTLLNHLFGTSFKELDKTRGINQTTTGIRIDKADGIKPLTIVMDLEGTDGAERGEDTKFEKQSALFALAVADILMINLWEHDIGHQKAGNRTLFETVLQAMMKLKFTPKKTTLMFVIRDSDKLKTPLEHLKSSLTKNINLLWKNVNFKTEQYKNRGLYEIFNVEIIALSHYVYMEEDFMKEVCQLRERFFKYKSDGGLADDKMCGVSADEFCLTTKNIWTSIINDKDLDIPTEKILVARHRCEGFANDNFELLKLDEEWVNLKKAVENGVVMRFGKTLRRLFEKYIDKYKTESQYTDESVRSEKLKYLKSRALELFYPSYCTMLKQLGSKALLVFDTQLADSLQRGEEFSAAVTKSRNTAKQMFDQGRSDASPELEEVNWDSSDVTKKLDRDIQDNIDSRKKILDSIKRCEKFANDNFERLKLDKDWVNMKKAVENGVVMSFGKTLRHLFEKYIDKYKIESQDTDESVRSEKLKCLKSRALELFYPSYCTMLKHLGSKALLFFDTQLEDSLQRGEEFSVAMTNSRNAATQMFDQGRSDASPELEEVNWDSSDVTKKLGYDIQDNIDSRQKILDSTKRCEKFSNDNFERLKLDEGWVNLEKAVENGVVMNFGKTLRRLFEKYIDEYNTESHDMNERVRSEKLKNLKSRTVKLFHPSYCTMLKHLGSKALLVFKTQLANSLQSQEDFFLAVKKSHSAAMQMFNQGISDASPKLEDVNWDSSEVTEKLDCDIQKNICLVWKQQSLPSLMEPLKYIFITVEPDTWLFIRRLLKRERGAVESRILVGAGSIFTDATVEKMLLDWNVKARQLVETKAKEAAANVLSLMKKRASIAFNLDGVGSKREWKSEHATAMDIEKHALSQCLEMLSTMAGLRLDDTTDNIQKELSALESTTRALEWGKVPPERTLITPVQCTDWCTVLEEYLDPYVVVAIEAQKAFGKEINQIHRAKTLGVASTVVTVGTAGVATTSVVVGLIGSAGMITATASLFAPIIGGVLAAGLAATGVAEEVKARIRRSKQTERIKWLGKAAQEAEGWKAERDSQLATLRRMSL